MLKIMRITTVPVSLLILFKNQLQFISKSYQVVAVSSGGEQLDRVASEANVKTIRVDMTRKVTPVKDFVSFINLVKVIVIEKPFIVHTHTPKAGLLGMMAAKVTGVPVRLHTVAGLPLLEKKGLFRHLLNFTEKVTYLCATRVYPNSVRMMEIINENNFCNQKKLHVIGNGSTNGIDTKYFDPEGFNEDFKLRFRESLKIERDSFVFCFIGRIVTDKGITELVEAFLTLHKINSNAKLLLVGPFEKHLDPLKHSVEKQIFNHPSIIWVDYQDDVRPFLSITNVFVFPSYREGFPNVLMQAGAMGIPCIASDINGCNEIIKQGKNGLIVPVKNTVALLNAMKMLMDDNGLLTQLAKHSRTIITSNYECSYVMNELLKEYNTQIENYYSGISGTSLSTKS
jgi:glycosyltransferase involved in cell wall biosynthesis